MTPFVAIAVMITSLPVIIALGWSFVNRDREDLAYTLLAAYAVGLAFLAWHVVG